MNKNSLKIETIEFNSGGKKYKWEVISNIHTYGLSIEAAFINWSARTEVINQDHFFKYVKSKDPQFVIMTLKQYYKNTAI